MPANFEYKPLGYEAFAQPLSQMQQYYDATRGAIEDLDFEIQHLPYGTDPQRAKELAEEMGARREELTQNLIASKDYRAGARSLKGVQKDWGKNAERRALAGQYASWQKTREEQEKRIGAARDFLTRPQYEQWVRKSIRDFDKAGGTNFQADEFDGTWNKIGSRIRIGDKTKEIKDEAWKAAKAMTPKKWTKFQSGVQGKRYRNVTKTFERLTPKEIAAAVEDHLRDQPDFIEWAAEAANYDLEELLTDVNKNTGIAEKYNKVADELIGTTLKGVNTTIEYYDNLIKKDKKYKDLQNSDSYKNLTNLRENLLAEQTNQLDQNGLVADPDLIRKLFFQDYLHDVFDAESLGELFEVDNITQSQSFNNIPGAHGEYDKYKIGEAGGWNPGNTILTTNDLNLELQNQGTQLQTQLSKFNTIGGGAFGNLSLGIGTGAGFYTFNDKNYRKTKDGWAREINGKYVPLTKGDVAQRSAYLDRHAIPESENLNTIENAGKLHARQGAILDIFNNGKNKNKEFTWEDFKRDLWNGGVTKNRGMSNTDIQTVFSELNDENTFATVIKDYLNLNGTLNYYQFLDDAKRQHEEGFEDSQEYQNYISELGWSKPDDPSTFVSPVQSSFVRSGFRVDPNSGKNVKGKDFTEENLKGGKRLFTIQSGTFNIFKPEHYTAKELKKVGVEKEKAEGFWETIGTLTKMATGEGQQILTFEQVAILQGYKGFKDAVKKGYGFNGYTPDGSNNSMSTLIDIKRQELIENNPSLNAQMTTMRYTGNELIDEYLGENVFKVIQDLTSFKPAGAKDFRDIPGFDNTGNPLEGTLLSSKGVFLNKVGSELMYEVVYDYYPEGSSKKSENTVFVKPKKGTYALQNELLSVIKTAALNSPDTPTKKQNLDMVNAALFNLYQSGGQEKMMPFDEYRFDDARIGDVLYSMPSPIPGKEEVMWNFYKKAGVFEEDFKVELKYENLSGQEEEANLEWNNTNEAKAFIAEIMGWGILDEFE